MEKVFGSKKGHQGRNTGRTSKTEMTVFKPLNKKSFSNFPESMKLLPKIFQNF
jgi:hypothetical protein